MQRKTVVVLVLAAIWSVALIVAAAVAPVYSSSSTSSSAVSASSGQPTTIEQAQVTKSSKTLIEENGAGVLALVAIPLVIVAGVSLVLWRRGKHGKRGAGPIAWTAVALLGAFVFIAILSIGIFIVPVFGLLVAACAFAATSTDPAEMEPQRPEGWAAAH